MLPRAALDSAAFCVDDSGDEEDQVCSALLAAKVRKSQAGLAYCTTGLYVACVSSGACFQVASAHITDSKVRSMLGNALLSQTFGPPCLTTPKPTQAHF
jgi:hypothetical protein